MSRWSERMSGETATATLLAVTLLVFAPISFAYNGVLASARPSAKNDFTSYYVAGLAVRHGMPEALYYPQPVGSLLAQASTQHPWIDLARGAGIQEPNYYLYPPLFAAIFSPLTLLPYRVAYVAWLGVSACLLGLATLAMGARLRRAGPDVGSRLMPAATLALVVSLFYPVARNLAVGQSSLLLLALMTGALILLRRGTAAGDIWGGLCLAGGILLKITPAVFLLWLAMRRRWRALLWSCAAVAVLSLVSVLSVGVGPHETYVGSMLPLLTGGTAFYPNQSLAGAIARAAGGDMRLADLVDPTSIVVPIAHLSGLALIAASLLIAWIRRLDDDHAFSLILLATLAASPISWEHHYVLALIPAWVLIADAAEGRAGRTRAAVAGGALALVGSYIGLRVIDAAGGGVASQVAASACLAGGLVLWALLAKPDTTPGATPAAHRGAALLWLACVFASGVFLFKVIEYNRSYRYGDFTSYYVAAATLLDRGGPLYYPDTPDMILARAETPSPWTETARRWGVAEANYYLYPPFFAMAMMPLALAPYDAAHTLWYIANLAALVCSVVVLVGARRGGSERPHGTALAILAVVMSWPALFTFGAGQANFIVLLLLVGALAMLRSRREAPAGLMLAGAAAIKITPVLLLVHMAWRRRFKALLAAAAGLAVLVAAGALVAGWSSYTVYMERMVPLLSRGCAHWVNESLAAFFTRLVDGGDIFSWALADPSRLARALASATGLLLVAGSFLVAGPREVRLDLEIALLVLVTLFVSPLSWTHHSVLSLLAFLLVARHLADRGEMTLALALALAISFTLVHVYVKPPGVIERPPLDALASYNLIGNLMLWGIIAWLLRREAGRTSREAAA